MKISEVSLHQRPMYEEGLEPYHKQSREKTSERNTIARMEGKENFKRYFQDGAGETWKGHLRSSPSINDLSLM